MARQDSRSVHCCRGFGQIRLLFALFAASHLQGSRTEVFFWRSYSGFAITHGLQTTKIVDRGRIELPSLRCKRSIIPSILTAQKWRGLSFAMTVCHATRLLSVMPPRNTTYSVRPHMTGTVIPIRTNPLTAAMFSVSYF